MSDNIIIELYKKMLIIRKLEELIEKLFITGKLYGTAHLCKGQEACAVGVCSALGKNDCVTSTHRGHGHYIAKGGSIKRFLAEIMGLDEGICEGKGGSQQIFDREIGFMGANGITGGGLPIAAGLAFAQKLKGEKNITVAFFGEGASNEGAFHETMNIAAVFQLPILFVCENNLYCMSTPFSKVSATPDVATRAKAYKIRSFSLDGNDVIKIFEKTKKIIQEMKENPKPILLELYTYRQCGHSKSDMKVYRTREEEVEWLMRCPLKIAENKILKEKLLNRKEIKEIIKATTDEIENIYKELLSSSRKVKL